MLRKEKIEISLSEGFMIFDSAVRFKHSNIKNFLRDAVFPF